MIGAPFGVLALDPKGGVSWLQLEPAENLQELAEMAQSQGWDAATVRDIGAGTRLLDLELQLALGSPHQAQPRQAFWMGDEPARLYAALFTLADDFSPGFMRSHERFLATRGERPLED